MKRNKTKLTFVGDLYVEDNDYNLSDELVDLFKASDFNIANLEAPVLNITKTQYPYLKAGPNIYQNPEKTKKILTDLNIKHVSLANNHIIDYGKDGILETENFLESNRVSFLGAGSDKERIKRKIHLNRHIDLISIAEEEFGVAGDLEYGHLSLYDDKILKSIEDSKKNKKFVILLAHGGGEEVPLPSKYIRNRYRQLTNHGADVIIGHHPHFPQGFEKYGGGLIFYSLGNFLFSSFNKYYSYIVQLEVCRNNLTDFKCLAVNVDNFNADIDKLDKRQTWYLQKTSEIVKDDLLFNKYLYLQSKDMFDRYYKSYFERLNPLTDKSNKLLLLDLLRNNSHREFVMNALMLENKEISLKYNFIDAMKYRQLRKHISTYL